MSYYLEWISEEDSVEVRDIDGLRDYIDAKHEVVPKQWPYLFSSEKTEEETSTKRVVTIKWHFAGFYYNYAKYDRRMNHLEPTDADVVRYLEGFAKYLKGPMTFYVFGESWPTFGEGHAWLVSIAPLDGVRVFPLQFAEAGKAISTDGRE